MDIPGTQKIALFGHFRQILKPMSATCHSRSRLSLLSLLLNLSVIVPGTCSDHQMQSTTVEFRLLPISRVLRACCRLLLAQPGSSTRHLFTTMSTYKAVLDL